METTQKGKFYFGWLIVLTGFILMMFGYVSFCSVISVFMIPVTSDLGFSRTAFAFYFTILALSSVVVASFMGKVMAKGNIKLIMLGGAILACAGFFGFSRATELMHFYLFAVLLGIGFGLLTTMPISILINNWFGGKIRGTAMGISFIGSGLGGLVLTPLLNNVISSYGWRSGYLAIMAIFALIIIPAILLFVVKTPEEKGLTRMGQTDKENADGELTGMLFKDAKKTSMLWMMLISVVVLILGSSAILTNSVPYFIECGFTPAMAATLAGLALGSLIIGKPLVGAYCDRWGIRNGAIYTAVIFALGFFILFLMPHAKWLVIGYILCYCFGGAAITVCPPLMVNGLFGEKDYGTIVGIVTMATSIGGAFGPLVATKIYDVTGSYSTFWLVATVLLAVSALLRGLCFKKRTEYDY